MGLWRWSEIGRNEVGLRRKTKSTPAATSTAEATDQRIDDNITYGCGCVSDPTASTFCDAVYAIYTSSASNANAASASAIAIAAVNFVQFLSIYAATEYERAATATSATEEWIQLLDANESDECNGTAGK